MELESAYRAAIDFTSTSKVCMGHVPRDEDPSLIAPVGSLVEAMPHYSICPNGDPDPCHAVVRSVTYKAGSLFPQPQAQQAKMSNSAHSMKYSPDCMAYSEANTRNRGAMYGQS